MNLQEALMLVRDKFLEEQKGIIMGDILDKYKEACNKFPALMKTVHIVWALELNKGNKT
jgi:hypothetical protein